jgi:predicted PurR-regulated permease PerM
VTDTGPSSRPLVGSSTLERWGRTSWLAIGVVALASVVYTALAAVAGIVVPLVIAIVIGMLATPVVDRLESLRVPRSLAAGLTIIGIVLAVVGSVAVAVSGLVDQSDEIGRQLTAGLAQIDAWSQGIELDIGVADERVDQAKQFGVDLIPGLATWLGSAFSGVISFLVGSFIGLFLLYFVLADWEQLRGWAGRHLGVPADLGEAIIDDATGVMRQAFSALTLSSLVTAVLIGGTMAALGVPLAFTVALVTFFTSYIPYLGAIFSATFDSASASGSSPWS